MIFRIKKFYKQSFIVLQFKKITPDDIKIIEPFILNDKSAVSDRTLGVVYLFRDYYSYCIESDTLFLKSELENNKGFLPPMYLSGDGDLFSDLKKIKEYAGNNNTEAKICYLTEEEAEKIKELFNGSDPEFNRDYSDYFYDKEALLTLKGKHLSGQRNFINRFKKNYPEYRTEKLSEENIGPVDKFLTEYYEKREKASELFKDEKKNVFEFLNHVKNFGFLTLALFAGDEPVAFSVGEIRGNVLFVHEEKADASIKGSYQMIVNEFVKTYANENVTYINREDDSGDEGLRISKESYHPAFLLNKFSVKI